MKNEIETLKEKYLGLMSKYRDFKEQSCDNYDELQEYKADREIMRSIARRLDELEPR